MGKLKDRNLYLVLSETCGKGRRSVEIARQAIDGGIDMLQMREKGLSPAGLMSLGAELCRICRRSGVSFIVNDDPALAKKTDADGVHLGQEDLKKHSLRKTRKLLGPEKIIGVSTHSLEQFKNANMEDFDSIAFGPIFLTKTKDYFIGTGDVGAVLGIAKKPVVFIGDINFDNVDDILEKGAKNIALIRAVLEAPDIKKAAEDFKKKLIGRGV